MSSEHIERKSKTLPNELHVIVRVKGKPFWSLQALFLVTRAVTASLSNTENEPFRSSELQVNESKIGQKNRAKTTQWIHHLLTSRVSVIVHLPSRLLFRQRDCFRPWRGRRWSMQLRAMRPLGDVSLVVNVDSSAAMFTTTENPVEIRDLPAANECRFTKDSLWDSGVSCIQLLSTTVAHLSKQQGAADCVTRYILSRRT
jgi:hypothetical protein